MPWLMTATISAPGFKSSLKRFFVFPQIKSVSSLAHLRDSVCIVQAQMVVGAAWV